MTHFKVTALAEVSASPVRAIELTIRAGTAEEAEELGAAVVGCRSIRGPLGAYQIDEVYELASSRHT
jgi:hypothetical protein